MSKDKTESAALTPKDVLAKIADLAGMDGSKALEDYENPEQKQALKSSFQLRIKHRPELRDLKLQAEDRETKLETIVNLVFRDQISPRQLAVL